MSGIRLQHPTARSGTVTFEFNKRPLVKYNRTLKRKVPTAWFCLTCKKEHAVKTVHLQVDHEGYAFVSQETWKSMQKYNTAGFSVANEVAEPPQQIVGMAPGPEIEVLEL